MKHQSEYRDPALAMLQLQALRQALAGCARSMTFMEVCGTHTMAIARYGLRALLPEGVRLISGPGCPVCVTPTAIINAALAMAEMPAFSPRARIDNPADLRA